MKLEYRFTRDDITFGTDAVPLNQGYLTNSNVFHAPQYGVNAEPIESIALAYSGPVGALDANVSMYLWDENTLTWYLFAEIVIAPEAITFVPLPNIIDRQDSRYASRMSIAIVATSSAVPFPAGDYSFALSSSTAGAGGGADLDEPIEVEGTDADGDAATTNPVVVGGIYLDDPTVAPLNDGEIGRILLNVLRMIRAEMQAVVEGADPGPLLDGLVRPLRLDNEGRLIVSDMASREVEGIDADGDAATAKPVTAGGIYLDDPALVPLNDGEVGRVLLNMLRMLIVEDYAYDSVTDANKVVSVFQTYDNHQPFDHSQDIATAAIVIHYLDARTFPFWSIIWSTAGIPTIGIEIGASNETTEPDLALRNYTDVTSDLYGGAITLDSTADIPLAVDTPIIYDSYRIVYTPSASTTWTAMGKKGSF